MPDGSRPLAPLVGNLWVPQWAVRPGSYEALRGVAAEMPLFLVIFSWDPDWNRPCYTTREQLGATLGFGRDKVSRQLRALRRAHLLFEVDRGVHPKTQRRHAPARWALDPFAAEVWRPRIEQGLRTIAEDDGLDGRWYTRSVTSLDAFHRRSAGLRNRIAEDMDKPPAQQRPRRLKRGSRGAKSAPGRKIRPRAQNAPGGEVLYQGGGSEAKTKPSGNGNEPPAAAGGQRASHPRPAEEEAREKIGPESTVGHTRDTPESQERQSVSGVQGAESAPAPASSPTQDEA